MAEDSSNQRESLRDIIESLFAYRLGDIVKTKSGYAGTVKSMSGSDGINYYDVALARKDGDGLGDNEQLLLRTTEENISLVRPASKRKRNFLSSQVTYDENYTYEEK